MTYAVRVVDETNDVRFQTQSVRGGTMPEDNESLLFKPMKIGSLEISGRVMKAPMTEFLCDHDGYVTDAAVAFYEEFARAGTPLLINGSTYFSKYSQGIRGSFNLDDDDKIEGLLRVTDAVHKYGSRIFTQIFHVGRQCAPELLGRDVSLAPSAVKDPTTGCVPKAMTIAEIQQTVIEFGDAAARAKAGGFDGIQLHAAHGYLISAFLTPHTNRRTDDYGGSFENRLRFGLEVYREMRRRVGDDYPIILKLNGHDLLPLRKGLKTPDLVEIARCFEAEGIDGIEVTAGHYESGGSFVRGNWSGFFKTLTTEGVGKDWPKTQRTLLKTFAPLMDFVFNRLSGYKPAFNLQYAEAFTKALNIPVMSVGGFTDKADMEAALQAGKCDMISVGRAFIADPHLYYHLKHDIEGPKCSHCQGCFARSGTHPITCWDPEVLAQRERMLSAETDTRMIEVTAG